ncbi:hypothetical protein BDN71DRAFT_1420435 [Pleurotus eryngii]|uniref:Mucoidy inhibitor A n=1 Tax=Pleurotus eryngii TaxID=5323 RepID=A0A9P5ZS69_PLEER|nr:hypothetical protein BDN71DRAFT_1420435 [Pleurotus eryngii]
MSKELLAPSFIHKIDLVSAESSKIDKVSLYVGRAEITRSFKIDVKTGQNQVKISELPTVLDTDSMRVEGWGPATILGVTVSDKYTTVAIPPSLSSLEDRKEVTQKAIARCTKAMASIEAYLGTLDAKSLGPEHLGSLMDAYETQAEKLDLKLLKLQAELKELLDQISQQHALWAAERQRRGLVGKMATIDIFVETDGKTELVLIYAVAEANWSAVYDIRADMSGDNPLKLVYKAAIKQSTGESWDDVSLILETVTPAFGVALPGLDPWRVGVYKPPLRSKSSIQAPSASYIAQLQSTSTSGGGIGGASMRPGTNRERSRGDAEPWYELNTDFSATHRETVVANQGSLNASFRVPGCIAVPSDGEVHTVTVVELQLEATMAWIGIPRAVPKVHIKAKIKNSSNFPLLNGIASVYVDGSFVSKTTVPEVSPQESFDCSLGVDPSIRLTYHPLSKNSSESGFYNKSSGRTYSQHITVHNTKNITIRDLTIIDHIPLSENSQVTIKLINPALPPPPAASSAMGSIKIVTKSEKAPAPLKVGENIVAQWDEGDGPQDDVSAIGREGRIAWKCVLAPQSKANIALAWEVSAPANITITGL